MQTPVYAHAVVHEVSDQDHVFEGVPMAQAIPIYPFPNGFVPASGVKNSLDDGAPAVEPQYLEDDGAASTPKTTQDKKRKRSRRYAPAANPSPAGVAAPPVPVVPIPVVEAPSTQPESNAIRNLAAGGWGAMMKVYQKGHNIAAVDVNVLERMRDRAIAKGTAMPGQPTPHAAMLAQDGETLAERVVWMDQAFERTRREQARRATYDLISTSEFPSINSAAGLRRFVSSGGAGLGGIVGGAGGSHTHTYHLASSLAMFCNGEAMGLVDTSAHPLLAQELEAAGWVRAELPIFASMVDAELAAAGLGEGGGEEEEDGEGEGENGVQSPLTPLMGLSPLPTLSKGGGVGTSRPEGPPLYIPPTLAGYRTILMGNGKPIAREQEILSAGERQGRHSNWFACAPALYPLDFPVDPCPPSPHAYTVETNVAFSGTTFDSLLSWTKEDMQIAWGTECHKNHGERKQILQIYLQNLLCAQASCV